MAELHDEHDAAQSSDFVCEVRGAFATSMADPLFAVCRHAPSDDDGGDAPQAYHGGHVPNEAVRDLGTPACRHPAFGVFDVDGMSEVWHLWRRWRRRVVSTRLTL